MSDEEEAIRTHAIFKFTANNAQSQNLDMSNLKPGVYVLQVVANNENSTHRIVKL